MTPLQKDLKQRIWWVLQMGPYTPEATMSGHRFFWALQSRATDFGARDPLASRGLGPQYGGLSRATEFGARNAFATRGLGPQYGGLSLWPRILPPGIHSPVLKNL